MNTSGSNLEIWIYFFPPLVMTTYKCSKYHPGYEDLRNCEV